jgi:hypothetical protein
MARGVAEPKLMDREERDAAMDLARSVTASRAYGKPVDDDPETIVRLARAVKQLCRHADAVEAKSG